MKLYGFTKVLGFPCFCYGKRGYFFKIGWGKKDKKFHIYKGYILAENIVFQTQNTYPKSWFFGFMINNTEEGYFEYNKFIRNYEHNTTRKNRRSGKTI